MRKKLTLVIVIWGVTLLVLIMAATSVYAQTPTPTPPPIPNPGSIVVSLSKAYIGVLQADDVLMMMEYYIRYDTTPSVSISQAFILRVFSGSTEIATKQPFLRDPAASDRGYEVAAVGFYFTPEEAISFSLLSSGFLVDTVSFHITGSPTYPTINIDQAYNVSEATGSPFSMVGRVSRDLANPISRDLEADWGVTVLEGTGTGFQLSGIGQDYFVTTVPRIAQILPEIFPTTTITPVFPQADFQQTYLNQRDLFVQNTPFYPLAQSINGWLNIPISLSTTLIWFGLTWAAVAFFIATSRQQDYAVIVTVLMTMVGSFIGMVPGILGVGLVGFATIGPTVAMVILKRHSG